jgi:AraC family transcriptional regulator
MDPVQKALWFVESHFREPIALEDVARACRVSSFHLTRAFASTTGLPLMRYVRSRRLSEAALRLQQGAQNILAIALDAGYASHEAFTRAFRDQFGLTPEQVRAQGHFANISIVEAIAMDIPPLPDILAPRFEVLEPFQLTGLVERYACESPQGIPDQWQRFNAHSGLIPGNVGRAAYGVSYNFDSDSNFDYMCGVETKAPRDLPAGFQTLRLEAQKYAVFLHTGHVAGIRGTLTAIWRKWFPESGCQAVEAPMFERYGPEFNPATGMGGFEIWIPVRA